MLQSLTVRNLALVEDITVSFETGLNIVTGETGAGKSILIGALDLLIGERADKSLVRSGAASCVVEGVFALRDPQGVDDILGELGLPGSEDGQLIIRRVVKAEGGGQAVVNDAPVTVQALKRIGTLLLDMHGPYDHQSLLHTDAQRDILDAFGHLEKSRHAYEETYATLRAIDQRIEELASSGGAHLAEQLDLLSYKVKELEDAKLSETEEQEVEAEHAVFGNAQRIVEQASMMSGALTEGEDAAADRIAIALRAAEDLARLLPEAAEWQSELEEAAARIRSVSESIASRMDRIEADPARLDWLDQRLTTYRTMKRKYGPTVADALAKLEEARGRLEDLQHRDARLASATAERDAALATVRKAGQQLHQARRKAADALCKAITKELQALGFAHGRFGVEVNATEPGPAGMDAIEFQFEPNVGEGMRPLRQIASSGEISRVMLATKAVLARHDRIPLLVFDEIDANIGGETGGAVGRKLKTVAEHHQIICITHLPQVAMYGGAHLAVRKQVTDGRTRTEVVTLDGEQRAEELARMLGGRELTRSTLTHAREMLAKAAQAS